MNNWKKILAKKKERRKRESAVRIGQGISAPEITVRPNSQRISAHIIRFRTHTTPNTIWNIFITAVKCSMMS
uniref:Uncharacterized protein n=1 Tax=Bursaphelenchus xylophilus TaxID=6326 RepID=A0A1I7RL71_BURXY